MALAISFYSLIALWATFFRADWFLRFTILCLAIAPLLALPHSTGLLWRIDHLPFLIVVYSVALIVLSGLAWRGITKDKNLIWLGLVDLPVVVAAGAIVLVGFVRIPNEEVFSLGTVMWAAVIAITALAASWISNRKRYTIYSWLVMLCAAALVATSMLSDLDNGAKLFANAALQFVLIGSYLLLRRMGMESSLQLSSRKKLRVIRFGQIFILLIIVVPVVLMYWHLVHPVDAPREPLPNPNGYELLVRAGKGMVRFDSPLEETNPEYTRQKLIANRTALELAEAAVGVPSWVPVDYEEEASFLAQHDHSLVRSVGYLLAQKGRFDADAGDIHGGTTTLLNCLLIARQARTGGLLVHFLSGNVIDEAAIAHLNKLAAKLSTDQRRQIIAAIIEHEQQTEPLDVVMHREYIWTHRTGGWFERSYDCVDRLSGGKELFYDSDRRHRANVHVALCHFGVQQYFAEHRELPQCLEQLIPNYLEKVPQDPFDGRGVRYSCPEKGRYSLHTVGVNRVDEGGTGDDCAHLAYELSDATTH